MKFHNTTTTEKSRWTKETILKKIDDTMQYIEIAIYLILCWLLERFTHSLKAFPRTAARAFNRFFRALVRTIQLWMFMGVAVNLISLIYPEFPVRFPALYGLCDGFLQFCELAVRFAFRGVYAYFNGNFSEFSTEYYEKYPEISNQFANWISSLKF